MTKEWEELAQQWAYGIAECTQLENELRDFAERPPPYMTQREINDEKEQRRKVLKAYVARQNELARLLEKKP
jgi:hypothetical protein